MNATFVNPADLHSVWFLVRSGLEVILEKSPDTWIPEDVYCSIRTGNAQLFMIDNGFTVIQQVNDQWSNEKTLHIWITYRSSGNYDITDEFHGFLRKLADNAGIKRITFGSKRRWDKRSGAKVKEIIYELGYENEQF